MATAPGDAIPAHVGATLAAAAFADDGTSPVLRYAEVRHAGGAVATGAGRAGSSMGNRDGAFLVHLVGVVDARHDAAVLARHLRATMEDLGPALSARTYLNALDGPARAAAAATSIDAADRAAIAGVQAALDPDRVLRFGVDHISD